MNSILEFLDKKDQSNKYKVENKLPKKRILKLVPKELMVYQKHVLLSLVHFAWGKVEGFLKCGPHSLDFEKKIKQIFTFFG